MNEYDPRINERYAAALKYQCPICKRGFDKPKRIIKDLDAARAFSINFVVILIIAYAYTQNFIVGFNLTWTYALAWFFFWLAKVLFGKEVCPYCKSENIIKNRND